MRNRRRTSRTVAGIIIAVFIAVLGAGTWNALRPLPVVAMNQEVITAPAVEASALAWPLSGEAAVEAQGVTSVLTSGTQKALPTASIAKIITCLAVLQAKPLNVGDQGPSMTLTQADVDIYNAYVAKGGSVVR